MPKTHLTPSFVANPPKPRGKARIDYFDTQLSGFLLEVRSTGKATFYQRYRDQHGRLKQIRIGHPESISLDDARQRARQIRSQAIMGFDPMAELDKVKSTPTFKQFVEQKYIPFIQIHKRTWQRDQRMLEMRVMCLWGSKKMTEIERQDVEEVKAILVRQGYSPATVNRFLALIKYIFNLAERWEVIEKSPARHVKDLEVNNKLERYLTTEETRNLLTALKTVENQVISDLIEFLILTGARKGEAMQARWQDVNWEQGIWTVPMSKSGKPRYIPLSEAATKLLVRRKSLNGSIHYVFPNPSTGKPLVNFHWTWDKKAQRDRHIIDKLPLFE